MEEALEYIGSIPKFSKKTPLSNTSELLRRIGFDENKHKIIHIAGTNGKGSVCAFLSSMLLAAEKTVGRFTSPHLVRYNERISVNGEDVSDDDFMASFRKVKKISLDMVRDGYGHPSFFEFLFGMGADIFTEKEVEYIVLETGLGGRLDATNAIKTPVLTIITSIGLDHTDILGSTYAEIAAQKAGIIKKNVPVVYERKLKEVTDVIEAAARDKSAETVYFYPGDINNVKVNDKSIDFCLHNKYYDNVCFSVNGKGIYQVENGALAALAASVILKLPPGTIKEGLEKTNWTCRMQKLKCGITVDGAHNDDGIAGFLESVSYDGCLGKRILLFSAVKDKHYRSMADKIIKSGLFGCIVTGVLNDARGIGYDELAQIFAGADSTEIFNCENIRTAFDKVNQAAAEGDFIYAAGSLYLAGEILDITKEF